MQVSDVNTAEFEEVLALNEAAVPHVNSIDVERMRWFAEHAAYFRVAIARGRLDAFLVGLRPGTDYPSANYRWFCDAYEDFAYVDRVVVSRQARRRGLAGMLYDDFARRVASEVTLMTCEVNIRPANETSMRFHLRRGFEQVGSQLTEGGCKEVALLSKALR